MENSWSCPHLFHRCSCENSERRTERNNNDANANNRTRNCPESGRLIDSIEKIGINNLEIYPIPVVVTPSVVSETDAASTPREL
jgi:hypothetical protein